MLDYDSAITAIRTDAARIMEMERARLELLNSPLPAAMKDERDQDLRGDIERQRQRMLRVLRDLNDFPPYHTRHDPFLTQFHAAGTYDQSVFIMTKFPEPGNPNPRDVELTTVIDAVRDAVRARNFVPRVANDQQFHPGLWDNVELYLLGCRRGIAIVEDKYRPEMNPNVAMEWGWMRGMGRNVLYLVEQTFANRRADWSGLIERSFVWDDPVPGITTAVQDWLR
jgi:hypothetical protein